MKPLSRPQSDAILSQEVGAGAVVVGVGVELPTLLGRYTCTPARMPCSTSDGLYMREAVYPDALNKKKKRKKPLS